MQHGGLRRSGCQTQPHAQAVCLTAHARAAGIKVNCCCPGYCDTDMTSHRGPRSAHDGAQNAVALVTRPSSELPSGAFFQNGKLSKW